jgi:YD repeat-containing protein
MLIDDFNSNFPYAHHGEATRVRSTMVSDPVDVADGKLLETAVDFELRGAIRFVISRRYEAGLGTGAFGLDWSCMLDERIDRDPTTGDLIYRSETGQKVYFYEPKGESEERNRKFKALRLRRAGEALELRAGQVVLRFAPFGEGAWRLASVLDDAGLGVRISRDAKGAPLHVKGDGVSLALVCDASSRVTAIDIAGEGGARERIAEYRYDERGRLVETSARYGKSFSYAYDDQNRLSGYADSVGTRARHVYDAQGRVVRNETNGAFNGDSFVYEPEARRTRFRPGGDAAQEIVYRFDKDDLLIETIFPNGASFKRSYDADWQLLNETDGEGHVRTYSYDADGNIESVSDGGGRTTYYFWRPDGRLRTILEGGEHKTRFFYDDRGFLISIVDANGVRTDFDNDGRGSPVGVMRHDGLIDRRRYDDHGRLVERRDFSGGITRFELDAFGRVTAIVDPLGETARYAYGAGGDFWSPIDMTRPDGVATRGRRTPDGAFEAIDGEGRRTVYRYGPFDVAVSPAISPS